MRSMVVAFLVATLVSALATPLVREFAFRLGAVSLPGGRHLHGRTIPRLGGVGIFAAFAAPLIGLFFVESRVAEAFRADFVRIVGLLVGGLVMCVVGFLDDTRRVRALYKLYAQIAVGVLAWACGYRIDAVQIPVLGTLSMGAFALPVTLLWIVGLVNAINLIDGLDGLAAGVVFFAGLTNFVVAFIGGNYEIGLLMAAVLGAVLGFLFYNFNPARIFMGDSGSYFLGYVLATTSLQGATTKASTAVSLVVPVIALGVPIFDTLFAMVRRFLERRSMFSPDRGHIHHRLLDMGLTHRRAVLLLYGLSIVCTVCAISISLGRSWPAGAAMLVLSVALIGVIRFARFFERAHVVRRQKARMRSRDAEVLRRLLPEVPALFARLDTEAQVLEALKVVMHRAELCALEVVMTPDDDELESDTGRHEPPSVRIRKALARAKDRKSVTAFRWTDARHGDPASPDANRARYPIGSDASARAAIKFAWHSDYGEVSAQVEVLLQVIVDIVAASLTRVESAYAPAPATPPALDRLTPAPKLVSREV